MVRLGVTFVSKSVYGWVHETRFNPVTGPTLLEMPGEFAAENARKLQKEMVVQLEVAPATIVERCPVLGRPFAGTRSTGPRSIRG